MCVVGGGGWGAAGGGGVGRCSGWGGQLQMKNFINHALSTCQTSYTQYCTNTHEHNISQSYS